MGDPVQPLIDQLNAQVRGLTSGDNAGTLSAVDLANVRKDMGGGIEQAFNAAQAKADKNSPVYKQKGLDSLDNYTRYWYAEKRNPTDYTYKAPGTDTRTPDQVAQDLVTNLTTATTTAVDSLKTSQTDILKQLQTQNTSLTGLITNQANQFQRSQTDLLAQFQSAQEASAKQMADLVAQLNSNGQPAKKPNYARALAQNKALNSGGLSSTMLTGPAGVASTAMTLGRTSLLGA